MAKGLYIDARQLTKGAKAFDTLIKNFPDKVSDVLNANADDIVAKAKRDAPADRGQLRQGISIDISNPLRKHITSHAPYSAYIEFGTGKYAAQKVSEYPAEYQQFASRYKGKGSGGNFKQFVKLLAEWVRRKGLAGTYSVKTKRRTGNKAARQQQDLSVAYAIAISILKNGVHPHPFLIPALIQQAPKINRDMIKLINELKL